MGSQPTIKDIARACGVSYPTVSYVFNNSRAVSVTTRELVMRTAREMGYSPNALARGLVGKPTRVISVLVNNIHYSTSTPIIAALEAAARDHDYRLLLALQTTDGPDRSIADLRELAARSIDGIVFISSTDNVPPDIIGALAGSRLPVVLAYSSAGEEMALDAVLPDHVQGGRIAAESLLASGRRAIAFIGSRATNSATAKRLEGFRSAHQAAHVQVRPNFIVHARYTVAAGRLAAESLLAEPDRPDAIFAADDSIACGVLQACRAAGVRVPRDVAVIGFNDSVLCEATDPTLTSVAMPFEQIGQTCLTKIIAHIENKDIWSAGTERLPCRLVVRETT
ncbi:MAG: LacI family DNA-binding transcriptional regulator [Capsulimonadaceae bacterium]